MNKENKIQNRPVPPSPNDFNIGMHQCLHSSRHLVAFTMSETLVLFGLKVVEILDVVVVVVELFKSNCVIFI